VHGEGTLPGTMTWTSVGEWPHAGDFGFVWGCRWGDDSSWKVQYLDLSRIQQDELRREESFGHLKLAARPDGPAREFIRLWSDGGCRDVEFVAQQGYDLDTGGRNRHHPLG
jgi:hypothetical protein